MYVLVCIFLHLPLFSQLKLSAELRSRVLVNGGYGTPLLHEEKPGAWVSQRTRLNTLFTRGSLQSYISIQDARLWGDDDHFREGGTFGNTGSLRLHQGWFRLEPVPWFSLKAGRQLIKYDDERIIASRNWNDFQVVYDALLMQAAWGMNRIDLGVSWNSESASLFQVPSEKFKTFDFFRLQRESDQVKCSVIGLLTGNTVADTLDELWYRGTWGANLGLSGESLHFRGSAYYQHHLNRTGGQVSAFCGSVLLGGEVIPGWLDCSAGMDYVSGQDEMKQDPVYREKEHAFDLLYGRRHGWYGYMDYFSRMPKQGLQDYLLKASCTLAQGTVLKADYHFFRLAGSMQDQNAPGTALGKNLGSEIDLTLSWDLTDYSSIQAGYSLYFATHTLLVIKEIQQGNHRFPHFAYLMVTLTPSHKF
jgi:hypothetical protein